MGRGITLACLSKGTMRMLVPSTEASMVRPYFAITNIGWTQGDPPQFILPSGFTQVLYYVPIQEPYLSGNDYVQLAVVVGI